VALTAAELMSRDVVTVGPDQTVRELVTLLVGRHISGAPVVDDQGHILGVVSVSDVVQTLDDQGNAREAANAGDGERPSDYYRGLGLVGPLFRQSTDGTAIDLRVAEIMTPYVIDVPVNAPVDVIARRMVEMHLHRLLVTQGRKLLGVISALDILGAVAHGQLAPAEG
jgi:CBS domain-containing protein